MSNEALFARACEVIPGGVDSPVRSFRGVGGTPYFVARAEGAYVWDVEGRRYLDYVQSYGASIVGHAHSRVVEAVRDAAAEGSTFGAPTRSHSARSPSRKPGTGATRPMLAATGSTTTTATSSSSTGTTL